MEQEFVFALHLHAFNQAHRYSVGRKTNYIYKEIILILVAELYMCVCACPI